MFNACSPLAYLYKLGTCWGMRLFQCTGRVPMNGHMHRDIYNKYESAKSCHLIVTNINQPPTDCLNVCNLLVLLVRGTSIYCWDPLHVAQAMPIELIPCLPQRFTKEEKCCALSLYGINRASRSTTPHNPKRLYPCSTRSHCLKSTKVQPSWKEISSKTAELLNRQ